ncbi:MAG: nitroreductase family protein [Desulfuromonadaceae bacterium]|nr:nitroreductase family protein [Desulfuromonadaceae bacterium]
MSQINVEQEKCKLDGICAAVCPMNIIELKEGSPVPKLMAGVEELCIKCGHCVAVCPHGALSLDEMKSEDCPPVRVELALGSEQAEHFLRSRRSIRNYSDKTVEREKLAKLIDMAHYAQTGTNSQQVHWLVINSKEKLHDLAGIVIDMLRHLIKEGHPMAKAYRLDRSIAAWEAGRDPVLRGAPVLVVTHAPKGYALAQVDSSVALTFLDLAAPTLGLGSCWAGFFMMAAAQWPPLQQALSLPNGHACSGAMMVGYPTYRYQRLPLRKDAAISWRE